MRLERKHAVLLLAIAVWNVVTYATFTKNLAEAANAGEDRPAGYYIAHVVLIVVNLLIAVALAVLGRRAWRATSPESSAERVSS